MERVGEKVFRFVCRDSFEEGIDIGALKMVESGCKVRIEYNKFQGRPSVDVQVEGKRMNCLLDTGAGINVLSASGWKKLGSKQLEECEMKLRCANNSTLETMGKVSLNVQVGNKSKQIVFMVGKLVVPEMIGGMEFLNIFGFRLQQIEEGRQEFEEKGYVCNMEAKFGELIDVGKRWDRAKCAIDWGSDKRLMEISRLRGEVFMANKWDVGKTHLIKHTIHTNGGPINVKPYRQPMNLEDKIDDVIRNLFENDIIRRCNSPWNTPMVCVWKKERKEIRLCLDFRRLNKITERQAFPMPNVEEMLDTLNGTNFFSSIDLGNAYYQVELDEQSQEKTAFSTKQGQYCFKRMPFGIAAAPGTFQELMNEVIKGIRGAMVYLDDILIFSKSKEEHYQVIGQVLDRILAAGLRINPDKCTFMKEEIKFLGHIISKEGIRTDPVKVEAIRSFGEPKCVKKLRSFLGICNYYRKFIKDYATKARKLEQLCSGPGNTKLVWSSELEDIFNGLKTALTSTPILGFPDLQREFILDTDASFNTIGAVLSQADERGIEKVIAYGSHAMTSHEIGYCTTRKELLAVYYFCVHFKHYLYGRRFTLRTDHKAITFMLNTKKPVTSQFQTWINFLSSLDINLVYRKGILHGNADALSRLVCDRCTQCQTEHEGAKIEKPKTRLIHTKGDVVGIKTIDDNVGKSLREEPKIWLTREKRDEEIEKIHKSLCHAGVEKTKDYMLTRYDGKDLKDRIREVVRSCEYCQKSKTNTEGIKEKTIWTGDFEPFEVVFVDVCGPLKETQGRKKYILGIIDQNTKYIRLIALTRQDETTIRTNLWKEWILKFGCPREFRSDCGRVFESKEMREWVKELNISWQWASPYHHNTNGQIERQFRTIREWLNATMQERGTSDWAELLTEIEFALNATKQKKTQMSPAELVFGRRISRNGWQWQKSKQKSTSTTEPVPQLISTRRKFKVGDEVLVAIEMRNKGTDKFEGPYRVIDKIHDRQYMLEDQDGRRIKRNVEKLKLFLKRGV